MKQTQYNPQDLKKVLGNGLEKAVQKRCEEYLDLRGHIHGRVKTQGTYDEKKKCRRKNKRLFLGLPDELVFKKVESIFYKVYAIEYKREKGSVQSPHQEKFQRLWEASGNFYILARGIKDLQKAGL